MGFGRPAEKKGQFFSLAPEGEPAISRYGAPNGQGQLGITAPHGGGLIMEVGTTHDPPPDQVGGWGIGPTPKKSASHWSNVFFCPNLALYSKRDIIQRLTEVMRCQKPKGMMDDGDGEGN